MRVGNRGMLCGAYATTTIEYPYFLTFRVVFEITETLPMLHIPWSCCGNGAAGFGEEKVAAAAA